MNEEKQINKQLDWYMKTYCKNVNVDESEIKFDPIITE